MRVGRECAGKEVRQANKPCQVPTSLVREQLRNAVLQVLVGKTRRSSTFSRVSARIYTRNSPAYKIKILRSLSFYISNKTLCYFPREIRTKEVIKKMRILSKRKEKKLLVSYVSFDMNNVDMIILYKHVAQLSIRTQ